MSDHGPYSDSQIVRLANRLCSTIELIASMRRSAIASFHKGPKLSSNDQKRTRTWLSFGAPESMSFTLRGTRLVRLCLYWMSTAVAVDRILAFPTECTRGQAESGAKGCREVRVAGEAASQSDVHQREGTAGKH